MMGYDEGGWGAGQWLAMGAVMVVCSVLVTGLVVWAVRAYGNGATSRSDGIGGADRVLADRYARGEIDEEEFARRRGVLGGSPGSSPRGAAKRAES